MRIKQVFAEFKSNVHSVDWTLLAFLVLFLNVKLAVKAAALVLIFVLRPNFKFEFRLKNSRLPLFYLLVIGIALFNWLVSGRMADLNYGLVLATGVLFWLMCILAIHQVKIAVDKNSIETLHRTILVFFIINAVVSLGTYVAIILETGAINPYLYQGEYQKYFIGTGDYIKGISFDTSTTNAVLNACGVLYFLFRGKYAMTILCMAVLLLTGSNISNLLLCVILLFVFFFQSRREQKSIIVVCLLMLVTFLVKISPQNNKYFVSAYRQLFAVKKTIDVAPAAEIRITERPDSTLNAEERKQKIAQLYLDSIARSNFEKNPKTITVAVTGLPPDTKERPVIPGDSIHTPSFQHKDRVSVTRQKLKGLVENNTTDKPIASVIIPPSSLPGKIIAFRQTLNYLGDHPKKILTGAGMGNFSSKLAFRATAMKIGGGYPARFAYINDDFRINHLALYSYYFTGRDGLHSIINSPNSTYDQLLSEYGILGLLCFPLFYVTFFRKILKHRSYGLSMLLFMLGAFAIDYWFEQLSVVVFLEFLLLVNIKELDTINKHA